MTRKRTNQWGKRLALVAMVLIFASFLVECGPAHGDGTPTPEARWTATALPVTSVIATPLATATAVATRMASATAAPSVPPTVTPTPTIVPTATFVVVDPHTGRPGT